MVKGAYKVLKLIEERENEVIDVKARNAWLGTKEANEAFMTIIMEHPNEVKAKWSELLERKFKR